MLYALAISTVVNKPVNARIGELLGIGYAVINLQARRSDPILESGSLWLNAQNHDELTDEFKKATGLDEESYLKKADTLENNLVTLENVVKSATKGHLELASVGVITWGSQPQMHIKYTLGQQNKKRLSRSMWTNLQLMHRYAYCAHQFENLSMAMSRYHEITKAPAEFTLQGEAESIGYIAHVLLPSRLD